MLLNYLLGFIFIFLLITKRGIYHIECVESDQINNTDLQSPKTDVSFGDKKLLVKISYKSPWNDSAVQVVIMKLELNDNMQVPSNGDIQDCSVRYETLCHQRSEVCLSHRAV
ncbi:uncharacterized protein LOC115787350 isoform X2 [Archocentrus centrarchus]|uniref:uncharacterized protein LOC115787350 isoform X2 n=1 Tax=Archocentrus centrarchus TaxID=63155 RepID=UPI0011EA3C7B|nr:uncharacterized protein LOC115787350 isoform X2 [Archocentrus centrarchus]